MSGLLLILALLFPHGAFANGTEPKSECLKSLPILADLSRDFESGASASLPPQFFDRVRNRYPRLSLNTANPGKVAEFSKFLGQGYQKVLARDHIEPQGSIEEVIAFKASQFNPKPGEELVLVEDSMLFIDGQPVGADTDWLFRHGLLDLLNGKKVRWQSVIGIREGNSVTLYEGNVEGTLLRPSGNEGFGWDAYFQPNGRMQTLAEAKPPSVNARWLAVKSLVMGMGRTVATREYWDGPWQKGSEIQLTPQQIIDQLKIGQGPVLQLPAAELKSVSFLFEASRQRYKAMQRATLDAELKKKIDFDRDYQLEGLDTNDFASLLGYHDLLNTLGIPTERLDVEIRTEGNSQYLLVPIKQSILDLPASYSLAFTHDVAWANERFFENQSGEYLFGSQPGRSKFASVADLSQISRRPQVLNALGLEGYEKFSNGPLNIVQVDVSPEIAAAAQPKLVVGYKWREAGGRWRVADNFLKNAFPGYTSGGRAELVFKSFIVPAPDLAHLKEKGGSIRRLD